MTDQAAQLIAEPVVKVHLAINDSVIFIFAIVQSLIR
jgi:hypothetical protein